MPATPALPPTTVRQAVASGFMSRPTLRQVLEQQTYKLLLRQVSTVFTYQPQLLSAADIYVQFPKQDNGFLPVRPLLDVLLQAMVDGESVAFTEEHVFRSKADGTLRHDVVATDGHILEQVILDPSLLNASLNDLLAEAIEHFSQAHISYWNASDYRDANGGGVSRHQWLGEMLRISMACCLQSARLSAGQGTCVVDLLLGDTKSFELFAVEARIRRGDETFDELQPGLLVHATDEDGEVWLWCSPDGHVEGYEQQAELTEAFRWVMGRRYGFDSLSWQRYQLEGDVLLQQSGLMLEFLLNRVARLLIPAFESVAELEQSLFSLTDPAALMLGLVGSEQGVSDDDLLPWMTGGSSRRQVSAGQVLLDLGLQQAKTSSASSLEGIQGPYTYARQRLRQRIGELHPAGADMASDDLLITLEASSAEEQASNVTLTEWAVNKHLALKGAMPEAVRHRIEGTALPAWVTVAALNQLVDDVDVGGHYPAYVSARIDDPALISPRISRFAIEWRQQLLVVGLRAWANGTLSEARWQALAEFCRSGLDLKTNVDVAPLKFRVRNLRKGDEATYLFVLRFQEPAFALLYCPHYEQEPLACADDLAGLMAVIRRSPSLQSRILEWLSPAAKATYANGGFDKPHLTQGVGLPPDQLPIPGIGPVEIVFRPWLSDIDVEVFKHRRSMILRLADTSTVSNSEQRWAQIAELVITMTRLVSLLPGPVGAAARVVLALSTLDGLLDEQAYASESAMREQVLSRLQGMAWNLLVSSLLAEVDRAIAEPFVDIDGVPGRSARLVLPKANAAIGVVHLAGELERRPAQTVLIRSGWGEGPVARRKALAGFAAKVDLRSATIDQASRVYPIDGLNYVEIDGVPYQVQRNGDEVRIVAVDGQLGPALWRDQQWHLKRGLQGGAFRAGGRSTPLEKNRQTTLAKISSLADENLKFQKAFQNLLKPLDAKRAEVDREKTRRELTLKNLGGRMTEQEIETRVADIDRKIAGFEAQLHDMRLEAVTTKEQALVIAGKLDAHYLKLLKLTPEQGQKALTDKRNEMLGYSLTDAVYIRDELLRLSDRTALHEIATALNGRYMVEVLKELAAYRVRLAQSAPLLERALTAMQTIDELLVMLPDTAEFYQGATPLTVGRFIEQRPFNSVDMRFEHIIGLAELALNPSKVKSLPRWHKAISQLSGSVLRAAAAAHADVLTSNLSQEDRVEILQEAWHQYSMAIYRATKQINSADALVNADRLEAYKEQMALLKESVNALLQSGDEQGSAPRSAYPVSQEVRRAVRTAKGRLVVATEQLTEAGELQLVVSDAASTVLHRFRREDDAWREIVPEPAAPEPLPAELAVREAHARTVLEEGVALKVLAQEYIDNDLDPQELIDAVDQRIQRLEQAQDAIAADEPLRQALADAVSESRVNKVQWLTDLYSKTAKPGASALAFLHEQGLLTITYVRRDQGRWAGVFDEYRIKVRDPKTKKVTLWAAHFHLASQDANASDFTVGHLKLWHQRMYGRADEQRLRQEGSILHRGRLSRQQVVGIISFAP